MHRQFGMRNAELGIKCVLQNKTSYTVGIADAFNYELRIHNYELKSALTLTADLRGDYYDDTRNL